MSTPTNSSKKSSEGWILIHRRIRDHWIWNDPIKLRWWIDILCEVNHSPAKVNIGYDLIQCDRGQSIMSLRNWADRWQVNKDSARHFLYLLEKDGMITRESLSKTTRITVCNYDDYQINLHDAKTDRRQIADRSQTVTDLNKEEIKNDIKKEDEEERFRNLVFSYKDQYSNEMLGAFFTYWSEKNSRGKMRWQLEKTYELSKRLVTWSNREKSFDKGGSSAKKELTYDQLCDLVASKKAVFSDYKKIGTKWVLC